MIMDSNFDEDIVTCFVYDFTFLADKFKEDGKSIANVKNNPTPTTLTTTA